MPLFRHQPNRWPVATAGFLLVAAIGFATTFLTAPREGDVPRDGTHARADDELLAKLSDYAGSPAPQDHTAGASIGAPLADVETMINRLQARLEKSTGDVEGWRMLGWSYFNTGRYREAASAYARAMQLHPTSAEIRQAHSDAQAKADAATTTAGDPQPAP